MGSFGATGAAGAASEIAVSLDEMTRNIDRIMADVRDLPDASFVRRTEGPSHGRARVFDKVLGDFAEFTVTGEVLRGVTQMLEDAEHAIRATMTDLSAEDEHARAASERFLSILEDARADAEGAGDDSPPTAGRTR